MQVFSQYEEIMYYFYVILYHFIFIYFYFAEGRMSLFVGDRQKEPKYVKVVTNVNANKFKTIECCCCCWFGVWVGEWGVFVGYCCNSFVVRVSCNLTTQHFFEFIRNKRSANKDKKKEELIQQRFSELEDSIAKQKESIDLLQSRIVELLSTHEKVEHPVPDKSGILKKLDVLLRHQEENPHMKSTHENSNINKNP